MSRWRNEQGPRERVPPLPLVSDTRGSHDTMGVPISPVNPRAEPSPVTAT